MSRLDLILDRPGRHVGALTIPWSRDDSAYGQLVVPVIALLGSPGPTALFTAGVHGDEYEGQIVLPNLARSLDPARLKGRVLIVPRANPLAARAGRRTSPQDSGNLARLFPGDSRLGITAALAAAISQHLLPLADALVDLHAGGSTLEYLPCAWGRLPKDSAQAARVLDLLLAFGAPLAAVTTNPEGSGTQVAAALEAGKLAMAAELGGGGAVTPSSLEITRQCCFNVLAHLGLLDEPPPAAQKSELLGVGPAHFLHSPRPGLFQPAFTLGEEVRAGQCAGFLHDPERPLEVPQELAFSASGRVICRRIPAPCVAGDVLAHLAEPCARGDLLGS